MRKDPAGSSVASASRPVLSTSCSAPAAAAARSPPLLPPMRASPRARYLFEACHVVHESSCRLALRQAHA